MRHSSDTITQEKARKAAWERWFSEDYSWENLSKNHPTLYNYWKQNLDEDTDIIEVAGQKTYHIAHLPLFYDIEETIPTEKLRKASISKFVDIITDKLSGKSNNAARFPKDLLQGVIFPKIDLSTNIIKKDINANFQNCIFTQFTTFESATFADKQDFNDTSFVDDVSFENVTFSDLSYFNESVFHKNASFKYATFTDEVYFIGTKFLNEVSFYMASFQKYASFEHTSFPKNCENSRKIFDLTRFSDIADLTHIELSSFSAFDGAIFKSGLKFSDFKDSDIDLICEKDLAEILKKNSNDREQSLRSLERGLRVVKQEMSKLNDKHKEQILFRLELITHRRLASTGVFEKIFSKMYEILSDYGNSISKPIVFIKLTWIAFGAAYYAMCNFKYTYAFEVSASRIFAISAFSDLPASYVAYLDSSSSPWLSDLYRGLATLETTISISLTFLLLLAIKRKFQIG